MWKQTLSYIWQAFKLSERLDKHSAEIAALKKEAIEFAKTTEQRFAAVQLELQRLNARDNDLEREIRQERKLMLLQLENRLLRAKLQLPPADEDEE